MKKALFIFILFFIYLNLLSINPDDCFHKDNFYYKMNSFIGADYFPGRSYNYINYLDGYDFFTGWKYNINSDIKVWVDFTFSDKIFEKEILLHKTGISYCKKDFMISFKIDKLKYGHNSVIYNLQVKDRFYDFGVLEDYNYNGVEVEFSNAEFQIKTLVAAHSFHSLISSIAVKYSNERFNTEIYYLLVRRNEEYNVINHSFGIEVSVKLPKLIFYQSAVYQYLPTYFKGDKLKSLSEMIYSPNIYFSIGTNVFLEFFGQENFQNWQSQTFLKLAKSKFVNYIFYRFNRSEEFTTDYTNTEYSLLSLYKFTESFSLGINYSYFIPDFDQDYHQIGFQIEFNYEKDY